MKQIYLTLAAVCGVAMMLAAQTQNMTLRSQFTIPGESFYNDVWGYTDGAGNEIAIIGAGQSVSFADITDPDNPSIITTIPGLGYSTWRDMKTYGQYAYAVADQLNEGLTIYDLSSVPSSVTLVSRSNVDFTRAHNIYIDEQHGRLYVAGSDLRNQGLIVYDLTADPANPTLLASIDLVGGEYVHDIFVRDNIAYCSHGYNGYYIWDMTNPNTPILLGSYLSGGYNHSSWNTNDNNYAYWAEEVPRGREIGIMDISDLAGAGLTFVDDFKDPLLAPVHDDVTPHNPFIVDDFLIISYYEDGIMVFDISNPVSPVRVAYYDTNPLNIDYNGTTNNWGAYPFFPSRTILATDTENGVFVIQPDFYPTSASSQNELNGSVLVYPTVATDVVALSITLDHASETTLSVFSMDGSLVRTEQLGEITSVQTEIDVQALAVGVYTIQVQTVEGMKTTKFVKAD